jgi:peptidoglycan-associated lipoprotein
MRTKMMVVLAVAMGLVVGVGCQQQRKPKSASESKVKGLNRVYFDFDKSDIKSEYHKTMDDNAAWLKSNHDVNVTVEGHCDERGTEEYNMALGHRRANSAKSYLTSMGVDAGRMKTVSYGEERPLESCHNESCWWKNRRAEFVR